MPEPGEKVIMVTGATGKQGGAVAARLMADGRQVRVMTRDPAGLASRALSAAGAHVVAGSLDDPASLAAAVRGAHGVFSVQPGLLGVPPVSAGDEVRRGRNVADAAARAGVRHLVYSSVAGGEHARLVRAFAAKRDIEDYIRKLEVPATILRPASFMDNYTDPAFGVQTGSLASGLEPGTVEQLIAVDDIGALAALAFADPDFYVGKTIEIAGDELTPGQIAASLGRASGRQIPHVPVPVGTIRRVSPDAADAISFLNTHGYRVDIGITRQLYPQLMTFDTWLQGPGADKLAELFTERPSIG